MLDFSGLGDVIEQSQGTFYALPKEGRKQLVEETSGLLRLAFAIARILGPESQES